MKSEQSHNQSLNEELKELFEFVSPTELRKSIHEIFSRYLQTINTTSDLDVLKKLAEDFYFLYKFLEIAEDRLNEKGNSSTD